MRKCTLPVFIILITLLAQSQQVLAKKAKGNSQAVAAAKYREQIVQLTDAKKPLKALRTWWIHIGSREQQHSDRDRALSFYVLAKNELYTEAFSYLAAVKKPTSLPPALQETVRSAIPKDHFAWALAPQKLQKSWWKKVLQLDLSQQERTIPTFSSFRRAKRYLSHSLRDRNLSHQEKQWARWQAASWAAGHNYTTWGRNHLLRLVEDDSSGIDKGLIHVQIARTYYNQKKWQKSLDHYYSVSNQSPAWPDAIEERAWTLAQMKRYQKALSELISLHTPQLVAFSRPESFYLVSYIQLNICDFPKLFKNHRELKSFTKTRLKSLEAMANGKNPGALRELWASLGQKQWNQNIALRRRLPRLLLKDEFLQRDLRPIATINRQLSTLSKLQEISTDGMSPSAVQGWQAFKAKIKSQAEQQKQLHIPRATARLRVLARDEIGEFRDIYPPLQIAEAGVIQRIYTWDPESRQNVSSGSKLKHGSDANRLIMLKSPEVWRDEPDRFHADTKRCPWKGGQS